MRDRKRFTIITPVYNDWESFAQLLREIEVTMPASEYSIRVTAVDDCSITEPNAAEVSGSIEQVEVIRLAANLGHQRAIAIGLVQKADCAEDGDFVAVMDADGEDRPAELKRMIDLISAAPGTALVAQRQRRSEGAAFTLFYHFYVLVFRLLTGRRISFGNFSVLNRLQVLQIVHNQNLWNNFAATLIQSKVPYALVPTTRGRRYAGQSKMNFVSLVTHGLGAISVFSDTVFVRILLASLTLFALSLLAIMAVIGVRFLTDLAIPGWATTVVGFASLLSLQAIMMPVMLAFLQLSNRSSFQSAPKAFASLQIERIYSLHPAAPDVRRVAAG